MCLFVWFFGFVFIYLFIFLPCLIVRIVGCFAIFHLFGFDCLV